MALSSSIARFIAVGPGMGVSSTTAPTPILGGGGDGGADTVVPMLGIGISSLGPPLFWATADPTPTMAGAGIEGLATPAAAFIPTAMRSIHPPIDAQPLHPLFGAVCHTCHNA